VSHFPSRRRIPPGKRLESVHYVTPKQMEVIRSQEFITGFVGGRGSGKSVVGCLKLMHEMRDGEECMAVSPTYGMLEESTFPTFLDLARRSGRLIRSWKSPKPMIRFRTTDGGVGMVVFRSGEDPNKLRGPSKAWLWLDEASIMHADVYRIGAPILRHREKMGRMLMTFTPRGRQHWTFETFFKRTEDPEEAQDAVSYGMARYLPQPNVKLVHSTSRENVFLAEEYVDLLSGMYSEAMRQQELEGLFVDIAGLMFSREHFHRIRAYESPKDAIRVRYWDKAATEGEGAYTAGCLMSMPTNGSPHPFIVEHVVRGQWSPAKRRAEMLKWAEHDEKEYGNVLIYIELEGGGGGKESGMEDARQMAGYPVFLDRVSGGSFRKKDGLYLPGPAKVVRSMNLAAQVEAGNVAYVDGSWNEDWLDELCAFPESSYADQVDCTAGAYNKLTYRKLPGNHSVERVETPQNIGQKVIELQKQIRRFGKPRVSS